MHNWKEFPNWVWGAFDAPASRTQGGSGIWMPDQGLGGWFSPQAAKIFLEPPLKYHILGMDRAENACLSLSFTIEHAQRLYFHCLLALIKFNVVLLQIHSIHHVTQSRARNILWEIFLIQNILLMSLEPTFVKFFMKRSASGQEDLVLVLIWAWLCQKLLYMECETGHVVGWFRQTSL